MKRLVALAASILVQMSLGSIYAWSLFVEPFIKGYGWTFAQTQIVFGLTISSFTLTMVGMSRKAQGLSPRRTIFLSGLFFGGGYFLASLSGGNFPGILLGIGLLSGMGIGLGYVCPLSVGIAWFPKHKGLITGVMVSGFGLGSVVLSQFVKKMQAQGMDLLEVFRHIGWGYGVILLICSLIITLPSPDNKAAINNKQIFPASLRKNLEFWSLCGGIFCGTFAGLLIIGNLKSIGIYLGESLGGSVLAVSTFAAGNACGRIGWGWLSDRWGRVTIPLSLIFISFSLLILLLMGWHSISFSLAAFIVGGGYGACFTVYAARIAHHWGEASVVKIYPLVFLCYGVAGILGPLVGGWLKDLTGDYRVSLYIAFLVSLAGIALTIKKPR